jgi:hypothetical protein
MVTLVEQWEVGRVDAGAGADVRALAERIDPGGRPPDTAATWPQA